jgi:hypothetical protein
MPSACTYWSQSGGSCRIGRSEYFDRRRVVSKKAKQGPAVNAFNYGARSARDCSSINALFLQLLLELSFLIRRWGRNIFNAFRKMLLKSAAPFSLALQLPLSFSLSLNGKHRASFRIIERPDVCASHPARLKGESRDGPPATLVPFPPNPDWAILVASFPDPGLHLIYAQLLGR